MGEKAQVGQPFGMKAKDYNAFVDAARAAKTDLIAGAGQAVLDTTPGVVVVRNDSGDDQDQFAVLGIDDVLVSPTDRLTDFKYRTGLAVVDPDYDDHATKFVILQDPIANGGFGRAMVFGMTAVRINMIDSIHEYGVLIDGDSTRLRSCQEGTARILYKESGTGEVWAVVHFPFRPRRWAFNHLNQLREDEPDSTAHSQYGSINLSYGIIKNDLEGSEGGLESVHWDVLLKLPLPLIEFGSAVIPIDEILLATEWNIPSYPETMIATLTATAVVQDYNPNTADWDNIEAKVERPLQAWGVEAQAANKEIFVIGLGQRHWILRHEDHATSFRLSDPDIAAGYRYYGIRLSLACTAYDSDTQDTQCSARVRQETSDPPPKGLLFGYCEPD